MICKHILFIIFRVLQLFKFTNNLSRIKGVCNGKRILKKKTLNQDFALKLYLYFVIYLNLMKPILEVEFNKDYLNKFVKLNSEESDKNKNNKNILTNETQNCIICFDSMNINNKTDMFKFVSNAMNLYSHGMYKKWLSYHKSCPY